MTPEHADDTVPIGDSVPIGHPTASMRAVASSIAPLTAAEARRRLQRRQRRRAAGALAIAVVLVAGIATQRGIGDREVTTTAALAGGAPSGTGTVVGTTPGTIPRDVDAGDPGRGTTSTTATTAIATTTSTSPTSTAPGTIGDESPGTSTTSVAPGSTHLTGTYTSTNEMLFATASCPDQEHRRDGVFTFSDGTVWRYHTVFCATIDAHDFWLGTGTYTLTDEAGAVLSGDFVNGVQLPTYGVPYPMHITSGSGAYAGVTGSCMVDVYLVDGPFWHIMDPNRPGTFACDVSGWPTPPPGR